MAIKTTDIVPHYKEAYFKEAKSTLAALSKCTDTYIKMDNLYDVEGLETVKREMVGHLELLGAHYARVKRYKTMGDYLEESRKRIKSETVAYIVGNSSTKISTNQAEKVVYEHPQYVEKLAMIQQIRGFFFEVEERYHRYVDTLNNVRQSISLCRKDPNFKPVEDEQ